MSSRHTRIITRAYVLHRTADYMSPSWQIAAGFALGVFLVALVLL